VLAPFFPARCDAVLQFNVYFIYIRMKGKRGEIDIFQPSGKVRSHVGYMETMVAYLQYGSNEVN
jgi:hypothetical protein